MNHKIGFVVGNGLTIDFCSTFSSQMGQFLNPSEPFDWEFLVPDNAGKKWRDAFPNLASCLPLDRIVSFKTFVDVVDAFSGNDSHRSRRIEVESRHFVVFAYCAFQEQIDRIGVANWRWTEWLRTHAAQIQFLVSFNYDCLLERTAMTARLDLARFRILGNISGTVLFKPHGSIDYGLADGALGIDVNTIQYPLNYLFNSNDYPTRILLHQNSLRRPRLEAFVVLPGEHSPLRTHRWITDGYAKWVRNARKLSHCIFAGLSYWPVDRSEIDQLLDALSPMAIVIVANPKPSSEFKKRVIASGRKYVEWIDGPERIK